MDLNRVGSVQADVGAEDVVIRRAGARIEAGRRAVVTGGERPVPEIGSVRQEPLTGAGTAAHVIVTRGGSGNRNRRIIDLREYPGLEDFRLRAERSSLAVAALDHAGLERNAVEEPPERSARVPASSPL